MTPPCGGGCVPVEAWRAGARAALQGGKERGTGLVRAARGPGRGRFARATGCPWAGARAVAAWPKAAADAGAALPSRAPDFSLST